MSEATITGLPRRPRKPFRLNARHAKATTTTGETIPVDAIEGDVLQRTCVAVDANTGERREVETSSVRLLSVGSRDVVEHKLTPMKGIGKPQQPKERESKIGPIVQHRSTHCASEAEAQAWVDKLPKLARDFGIIDYAHGGDGSVVVSASWESKPVDLTRYKAHSAWDRMIPPEDFPPGEHITTDKVQAGDIIALDGTGSEGPPLSWALRVERVDSDGVHVEGGEQPIPHTRGGGNPYFRDKRAEFVHRYAVPSDYAFWHKVSLDPHKVPGGTRVLAPR